MPYFFSLILFSLILSLAPQAQAGNADFQAWLSNFRTTAFRAGLSAETINRQFAALEFLPQVIAFDRNQSEFKLSYADYHKRMVTSGRVETAQGHLNKMRGFLAETEKNYGVPGHVLLAFWGMESNFGKNTGKMDVLSSLATLAYDGRRGAFFEKELLAALRMTEQYPYLNMPLQGSWAGAMGNMQFLPSSYLQFAIDGNSNGRKDLWNEKEDIFASAANYLSKSGWKPHQIWGREVKLERPIDDSIFGLEHQETIAQWAAMGVKTATNQPLPQASHKASLLMPDGEGGRAFLVYDNFRVIMKWNRSINYALAIGELSDKIMVQKSTLASSAETN